MPISRSRMNLLLFVEIFTSSALKYTDWPVLVTKAALWQSISDILRCADQYLSTSIQVLNGLINPADCRHLPQTKLQYFYCLYYCYCPGQYDSVLLFHLPDQHQGSLLFQEQANDRESLLKDE